MKKSMFFIYLFTFLLFSCAEDKLTISPKEIDLGTLKINEKRKINVLIENKSGNIISVLKIQSSCKCLVSNQFKNGLMLDVDESLNLELIYKSDEIGDFLETILIFNDSEAKFETIKIKAKVI